MNILKDKYEAEKAIVWKKLEDVTNEYLGDFAIGKAVKVINSACSHYGEKFYVQDVYWIRDTSIMVSIRKAKKDGTPSANGFMYHSMETHTEIEPWDTNSAQG